MNPSESEVEAQVDDWLAWNGYVVLKTNEHRHRIPAKCPQCQNVFFVVSHKGSGKSKGIGDRLIRNPRWEPPSLWLMVELKRPEGGRWSSPEQRALWETGGTIRVENADDLEKALAEIEEGMKRLSK